MSEASKITKLLKEIYTKDHPFWTMMRLSITHIKGGLFCREGCKEHDWEKDDLNMQRINSEKESNE